MTEFDIYKAVIRSDDKSASRLVRVQANDIVTVSAYVVTILIVTILDTPWNRETICASPILSHNITRGLADAKVGLFPISSEPSRPGIPTAHTVTIARVTSPISVDRTYQPLFLNRLHEYFDHGSRLIKQGDIIAVAIDTDDLTWNAQIDEASANMDGANLSHLR